MITLIISIIYWCKPHLNGLGIAAMILSGLGIIGDAAMYGWLCIIDIIVLAVNIMVYCKHNNNNGGNGNDFT